MAFKGTMPVPLRYGPSGVDGQARMLGHQAPIGTRTARDLTSQRSLCCAVHVRRWDKRQRPTPSEPTVQRQESGERYLTWGKQGLLSLP